MVWTPGGGGGGGDDNSRFAETALIGQPGAYWRPAIPLATKVGTPIRNATRIERDPTSMREAERYAKSWGGTVRTRSLSGTYNCLGLVFGGRRTVIDAEHMRRILVEDGYLPVTKPQLAVGDLIVYLDDERIPTHVGVVWEVSIPPQALHDRRITVLSQWGYDGEYFHDETQVPAPYGSIREYYTERKP